MNYLVNNINIMYSIVRNSRQRFFLTTYSTRGLILPMFTTRTIFHYMLVLVMVISFVKVANVNYVTCDIVCSYIYIQCLL